MESNDCTAMVYESQWQERLGWRLFPAKYCETAEMEKAADVLVCRTQVDLSIIDRLKVLISGRVRVETKTTTEHIIGACKTNCVGFAAPPSWLERKE